MIRRTLIKICGLRTEDDLLAARDAGADMVGFVLAPHSPRAISSSRILELLRTLPPTIEPVIVVRNQPLDEVADAATNTLQLHGDEDEAYITALRKRRPDARIIRGFGFSPEAVSHWNRCPEVDVLLVDSADAGSGKVFDHALLHDCMHELTKPLFLAGGLSPDNVAAAVRDLRPDGVDVSSGVERIRGVKDAALMHAFCQAVQRADREPAAES